jgi:hypothetical protein
MCHATTLRDMNTSCGSIQSMVLHTPNVTIDVIDSFLEWVVTHTPFQESIARSTFSTYSRTRTDQSTYDPFLRFHLFFCVSLLVIVCRSSSRTLHHFFTNKYLYTYASDFPSLYDTLRLLKKGSDPLLSISLHRLWTNRV